MNKFAARGLIEAAASGSMIAVVSENGVALREAFDIILAELDLRPKFYTPPLRGQGQVFFESRIYRASGREFITFPYAGSIRFMTERSSFRGRLFNTVFIDGQVTVTEDMRITVVSTPGGEVVRA